MVMKKYIGILMLFLALVGCEKLGKDGRPKLDVDYSQWYNDDPSGADKKPGVMVMSFNVRYGSAGEDTGDKNWSNRRTGCYAMVNTLRPTLMGVQECQAGQRSDLMANLKGYESVGVPRDGSANGEQMAIFYLKDSVSIQSWGTFWLSETPDVVSKYPGAGHYRCATWAKVRHKKYGNEFYHINTHLDLNTVKAFEMSVIMDFIKKNCGSLPVVMTADWNESDDSAVFDEMYQTFSNARWTATTGDAYGTMNSFNNMNSSTKIDHVFYRGFPSCTKFVTVRQKWEGYQFISDHFPVYANLKF